MRKLLLKTIPHMLLVALLAAPQQSVAQDDLNVTGYTNIWIDVKAAPKGGGKVFAAPQQTNLKAWRDEQSFNQSVGVANFMGANVVVFFLYAQPATADGYAFAGWYYDDGDGVLDIQKDELIGTDLEFYMLSALDDDAQVYGTQAAAKAGQKPAQTDGVIFAYFTRGATVGIAYYQDDAPLHANCGTVYTSKAVSEPGDEVTVRALPNDGFQFEYWADAQSLGKPVSRENPYTFTVQGGEKLYAYFTAIDAPEYDFPEEGGYKTIVVNQTWVLTDESILDGAVSFGLAKEDMTRTKDGKVYLDASKDDARYDVTFWQGQPTILYGKGKVRFAYKMQYGFARENDPLVKWSGNGVTVSSEITYVYAFIDELGAFVEIGNTDTFINPNAPTSVKVPAGVAYIAIPAFDLTDDEGNIPTVIGLSPETYDRGVAGRDHALDVLAAIDGVRSDIRTIAGQKVYTLSGVEVQTTAEKGVYIVNGKKVIIK
ncbi:MAG: InlB B-repeat-containing protein [Prevotella sp.]|nr:InlB B-repeat-containing protein [Prevotella sp.]